MRSFIIGQIKAMITLSQFLPTQASPSLRALIQELCGAALKIQEQVKQAPLNYHLGHIRCTQIHGEAQQKLDCIADQIMTHSLRQHASCQAFSSEVQKDIHIAQQKGHYLVCFSPLNGASNLAVQSTAGTIFSILPAKSKQAHKRDFYQKGIEQVCAGYFLYGNSTQLMITFGKGVYLFSLHADQQFVLIQSQIEVESTTQEFAIDLASLYDFDPAMQHYIQELLKGRKGPRKKDFTQRWFGSPVADVHCILLRGGVYCSPSLYKNNQRYDKLHLLYEANPLAMLIEQAQGKTSSMHKSTLHIMPAQLDECVPVVLGSKQEVKQYTYHSQLVTDLDDRCH